jgi:hypothetical protein
VSTGPSAIQFEGDGWSRAVPDVVLGEGEIEKGKMKQGVTVRRNERKLAVKRKAKS